MTRSYVNLTRISLLHGYYTDGATDDFSLTPTEDTQRFFRNYRLKFGAPARTVRDKYIILQEQVNGGPLIELPATYQWRFVLSLQNAHFPNFTDLGSATGNEIFLFENQLAGTALHGGSFTRMQLVGEQFTWSGLTAGTTQVTATHDVSGDNFVVDVVSEDENGTAVLSVRLDLEKKTPGIYTLLGDGPGDTVQIYYDATLAGRGVFGIVHLTEGGGLSVGSDHDITFAARSAAWKYFLVLKGSHTGFDYSIFENISSPSLAFSEVPVLGLSGADGATRDMLSGMYSGATIRLIQSTGPIAYSEAPRPAIALGRESTTNGGSVVPIIKNLPNPDPGAPNAAVIVGVDPPNP